MPDPKDGTVIRRGAFWLNAGSVHEWPLVVFTALTIVSAGFFAARLVADAFRILPANTDRLATAAAVVLFAGLLASAAHLGRPVRAPLALRRTGRNALSTEVALAAALLVAAVVASLPGVDAFARTIAMRAAGLVSIVLLAVVGLVYFLPARWPWRSPLIAAPMTSGLVAGTCALALAAPPASFHALLEAALIADVIVHAWSQCVGQRGAALYPAVHRRRAALFAARTTLVDLVPVFLYAELPPGVAMFSVAAGLLVDRFMFYGTVCVISTEAAIADVERLIERAEQIRSLR